MVTIRQGGDARKIIFKQVLLALVALSLALPGCNRSPSDTASSSSAAWTSNPALLTQLGPAVQLDGFTIRPPQNCIFTETNLEDAQDTLVIYKWKQKRQDGSSIVFSVHIARPKAGTEMEPDIMAALQGLTDHNGVDYQNYAHSDIEKGAINGVPFARVYWKGTDPADSPLQHGLFYLTSTTQVNISIHGTDSEPYSQQTLPLCEAAALTFRLH